MASISEDQTNKQTGEKHSWIPTALYFCSEGRQFTQTWNLTLTDQNQLLLAVFAFSLSFQLNPGGGYKQTKSKNLKEDWLLMMKNNKNFCSIAVWRTSEAFVRKPVFHVSDCQKKRRKKEEEMNLLSEKNHQKQYPWNALLNTTIEQLQETNKIKRQLRVTQQTKDHSPEYSPQR